MMNDVIRRTIKEERNRQGLNQIQLGMKALGFGAGEENKAQKVISKIELGERDVTATELYQISEALGKSICYFLGVESGSDPVPAREAVSPKSPDEPTLRDLYEIRVTMDKLMVEIGKIKDRMLDAADNKDVTLLRKVSGNG